MNEKEILYILYAQPLQKRDGKSPSTICKEYYTDLNNYKNRKYQEEAQVWLLLSYLHDEKLEISDFFKTVITQNPKLEPYIRFFLWLCKIYGFTRKDTGEDYSLFEYFRSGQNELFLEKVQSIPNDEEWKVLTFTGAFSAPHFKLWRQIVYDIIKRKDIKKKNYDLYLSLAGDKKVNKKYENNIFDRMWTQIYNIICLAASEKQYSLRFSNLTPNEESQFEVIVCSIFDNISNDIETLYLNSSYPLIFRVHVAATFNKLPIDLLKIYVSDLISENLIGLMIFYASLADSENSILLLKDVLAAFEPSEQLIEIIRTFGVDEAELVCQIVERLADTTVEDFDAEVSQGEITELKIKCLEWLALVPSLKARALMNVRKIICSLILQDEYEGAFIVFNKFLKIFDNKKEQKCWQILIYAETEYRNWQKSSKDDYPESSFNDLTKLLKNVINFPGGWMIDCPDVDIEIGSHCIPLIADHLFEVYMSRDEIEEARGLSIHL